VGNKRWNGAALAGLLAALLVAAVVVSGCGSSGSSSSSGSTAESSESGTEETASAESSGEESSGGETDFATMLEETLSVVPPQFEGPTEPTKAPSGIKLGIISCSQTLQGCVTLAAASEKAAGEIGWEAKTYDGQSSTSTQNTQIANAISSGANVIELIAIDPKTVQTGLKVAEKAGALIVSADNAGSEPNPTIKPPAGAAWPKVDVSADYGKLAETTAEWIIADSEGKANVLVYGDKEYPAVDAGVAGLLKVLETCEECSVAGPEYFTAAQIANQVGPNVVSYLRSHPEVEYVYAPFDPAAAAMVTAIQGAGLAGKVKLVSYLGNQQNLEYLSEENVQAADGAVDNTYNGYAVIDQAIRLLNKEPMFKPLNENVPIQVLDKSNVGNSAELETGWVAPYPYEEKYVELWKGN
jgi:ribose transport system substrate-binding protein